VVRSGTQDRVNLLGLGIARGRTIFLAVNQSNSALRGNRGEIDLPTRCASFQLEMTPWCANLTVEGAHPTGLGRGGQARRRAGPAQARAAAESPSRISSISPDEGSGTDVGAKARKLGPSSPVANVETIPLGVIFSIKLGPTRAMASVRAVSAVRIASR
jgi:hypothetical protein